MESAKLAKVEGEELKKKESYYESATLQEL